MSHSIRACTYCGSLYINQKALCSHCFSQLKARISFGHRQIKENLEAEYLWDWTPRQDELLSKLLLSLKGVESAQMWSYFAETLLKEFHIPRDCIFIPIPTKRSGNHALGLSKALSYLTGRSSVEALELSIESVVEQKSLTKKQRAENSEPRFVVKNSKIPQQGRSIVLVDDIITTGGTALMAYKALGVDNNVKIWALASRSLAAD